MPFNAFIVDWSMSDYVGLKAELAGAGFVVEREGQTEHLRVEVPYARVEIFARLCQKHMYTSFNYVDIQFPDRHMTVIIFQEALHVITNADDNNRVKTWAIGKGLPAEQADWATSY